MQQTYDNFECQQGVTLIEGGRIKKIERPKFSLDNLFNKNNTKQVRMTRADYQMVYEQLTRGGPSRDSYTRESEYKAG